MDAIQAKVLMGIDLSEVKKSRPTDKKLEWPVDVLETIRGQNIFDIELYEWARDRSKQINQAILDQGIYH